MESSKRWVRQPRAAEHIGLSEATLEKDRVSGALGIPFHRAGRAILYELGELDEWLTKRLCRSTSERQSEPVSVVPLTEQQSPRPSPSARSRARPQRRQDQEPAGPQ